MSILDDAIREHLELKRAHGADDSELKKLEDEAFGPPQRPDEIDPFAEAPTEFLTAPGETAADVPEIADEHQRSGRRPDIADLQEPPPIDAAPGPSPADPAQMPPPAPTGAGPEVEDELSPTLDAPPPSPTDAVPLPPPPGEAPAPPAEEPPAIVDQPTQMFDVQAHVEAEAEADAPAIGEQPSPTDEELVDAVQEEPRAAPPAPEDAEPPTEVPEDAEPPTELHEQPELDVRGPDAEVAGHPPAEAAPEEGSAEFDFFNEQRLSDELDQALEAPLPPTDEHLAMPRYGDAPAEQGGIFDFESPSAAEPEERPYEDDPSQEVLRRAEEGEAAEEPAAEDDAATDYDPDTGHEDVLEDTPRFLEDAPEDDDLWFEQKPPKDFDLD
jgi:hypothetical protein